MLYVDLVAGVIVGVVVAVCVVIIVVLIVIIYKKRQESVGKLQLQSVPFESMGGSARSSFGEKGSIGFDNKSYATHNV